MTVPISPRKNLPIESSELFLSTTITTTKHHQEQIPSQVNNKHPKRRTLKNSKRPRCWRAWIWSIGCWMIRFKGDLMLTKLCLFPFVKLTIPLCEGNLSETKSLSRTICHCYYCHCHRADVFQTQTYTLFTYLQNIAKLPPTAFCHINPFVILSSCIRFFMILHI